MSLLAGFIMLLSVTGIHIQKPFDAQGGAQHSAGTSPPGPELLVVSDRECLLRIHGPVPQPTRQANVARANKKAPRPLAGSRGLMYSFGGSAIRQRSRSPSSRFRLKLSV
jgi:hypothetical protein